MPTQNKMPPDMALKNMQSLEHCRLSLSLTRGRLSEITGLSRANISKYETGFCRFSQKSYNALADVFNWQKWL